MSVRRLILSMLLAAALAPAAVAAEHEAVIWSGRTDGYDVRLSSRNLTLGRVGEQKPFYSARLRFLNDVGPMKPGEESHEIGWDLLSVVGPIVSVEEDGGGYVRGTAHPYAYRVYEAMDLRKRGLPAKLTDFFPKPAIYQALMGDRLVQKALEGKPRPASLDALIRALDGYQSEDCTYGFTKELLSSFAFHHVEGRRVAVRFGLTHGCEAARGSLTVLGVYLPIPPALATAIAEAQSGRQGFLQVQAPKKGAYLEVGTFE